MCAELARFGGYGDRGAGVEVIDQRRYRRRVRGVSVLATLSVAAAAFAMLATAPSAKAAKSANKCAAVTGWAISIPPIAVYYFVHTGTGWVSSHSPGGSDPFGTVDLSVSGTSWHAYNLYAPGYDYNATFSGTLSSSCVATGTWTSNHDPKGGTFTATPLDFQVTGPPYQVSGTVTEQGSNGKGVSGVPVHANCPGGGTTSTDAGGNYSFLLNPGACRISAGSNATPTERVVNVTTHDIAGVDFQVTIEVTISGKLSEPTCDDGLCKDSGVGGIRVVAQGTSGSGSGVSDKDGAWSIRVHPGTFTIAPEGSGWEPAAGCPGSSAGSCRLVLRVERRGIDFSRCEIDDTVSGWHFKGDCPPVDDWQAGAKNVKITAPDGGPLAIPQPADNDPLPVVDQDHRYELALPVVLPNLSLGAGGLQVSAYENTVDKPGAPDAGVNIGLGMASVQGFTAAVDDLNPQNGTAGDLELQFGDVTFDGEGVMYQNGTFNAKTFTVGLPSVLGGGSLSGGPLRVGSGGVNAQVTGGSFNFGGLSVEVANAKVEDDVLSVGHAEVDLPAYLGVESSSLEFRDLTYSFKTGALTGAASGDIHMSIGDRFKAVVAGKLAITPGGHWSIVADGGVEVPSSTGGSPLFMAHAHLEIQQPCTAPALGTIPCDHGFLKKADLSVQGVEQVPLGETGLAIDGLDAHVKVSGAGSIDASGAIQGFTYTFGLGAHVLTEDGGKLFQGHVSGALSTNGNLALTLDNATALDGLLTVDGKVCVIQSPPDDVCNTDTSGASGFPPPGPGVFINGNVGGNVSYAIAKVCEGHLGLKATAKGALDLKDPDVKVEGTLTVGARCDLFPALPAFDGMAKITGTLGLFRKAEEPAQPGILGTLDGKLVVRHPNGATSTIEEKGAFFIGTVERKLITDGADQYNEVGSAPAADVSLSRISLPGARGCTSLSVECGPSITFGAQRLPRSVAPGSDASTPAPGQQPTKALPWKSVPGTGGSCGYGVEWTGTQTQTSNQTGLAGRRPWRLSSSGVPILDVSSSDGACVAANIYAAIKGTDPVTGRGAVNVVGGKYQPFSGNSSWAQLHYGVAANGVNTSDKNRSSSCGTNPFSPSPKRSLGPVDKPFGLNEYFSCDEFPFASTIEGGRKDGRFSVIRGVPLAQNTEQGRLLWDFYRANLPTLKEELDKGLFYVCVDYDGQMAGTCS